MTSDSKLHPSNDVLEKYSLGHLPESELERVEEHLFVCEQCRDELTLVDSYIQDLKEACRTVKRQAQPERVTWRERFSRLFTIPKPVIACACAAVVLAILAPFANYRSVTGSPITVQIDTYRGTEDLSAVQTAARHSLRLMFNASILPASASYRAEVVNAAGSQLWTGPATHDNAALVAVVNLSLNPGQYWVRLYDARNNLVRESALRLK
jgi:predicted anti-sigma-YlaC factor YlaD